MKGKEGEREKERGEKERERERSAKVGSCVKTCSFHYPDVKS